MLVETKIRSVLQYGPLVQLGERHPVTVEVRGSRPLRIAKLLRVREIVSRQPHKLQLVVQFGYPLPNIDRNAQRCAAGLLIRVSQVRSLIGQPSSVLGSSIG